MENKTHLWNRSLIDQEWHIAIKVLTLETAHAGREREITHLQNKNKAKTEQLNISKTDP
jgi:hypothetical protein